MKIIINIPLFFLPTKSFPRMWRHFWIARLTRVLAPQSQSKSHLPKDFSGPVKTNTAELHKIQWLRKTTGLGLISRRPLRPYGIRCRVRIYPSSVVTLCTSTGYLLFSINWGCNRSRTCWVEETNGKNEKNCHGFTRLEKKPNATILIF